MLRSDENFAGEGRFGGTPAQGLFGGNAREIGIVVFLREVRENEVTRASIKAFRIGQIFADRVIGEMASPGEDALLDYPRIRADFQHVQVVIGFQDQAIAFAQMDLDKFGHVAEVGADGHLGAVGAEGEANGVGSIMRNGEGMNIDIANRTALAGLNGFDAAKSLAEGIGKDALQRVHGRLGNVKRRLPEPKDLRQTVAMIRVFVSNQDGVEPVHVSANSSKACQGFAFSKAGVNEDAGAFGFEQCCVARTAGREDGDAQTD